MKLLQLSRMHLYGNEIESRKIRNQKCLMAMGILMLTLFIRQFYAIQIYMMNFRVNWKAIDFVYRSLL